jgi:hypothetical protein
MPKVSNVRERSGAAGTELIIQDGDIAPLNSLCDHNTAATAGPHSPLPVSRGLIRRLA